MRVFALALIAVVSVVGCSDEPDLGRNNDGGDSDGAGDGDGCPEGQVVDGLGTCRLACDTTADCGDEALACDAILGICLPVENADCDPDLCEEGFVCPPSGEGSECVELEPGLCEDDEDCDFGFRCQDSECISRAGDIIQTCEDDGDCGILMTCQFGVCVGCLDDLQCGPGNTCVLGTCIVAELPTAFDCLTLECSNGERCNPITGLCEPTCTTDDECGEAQTCAPVLNQCIDEFGCDGPEDCLTNLPLCVAGLCVGCADDNECRPSETCLQGGFASVCLPTFEQSSACDGVECENDETCDPQGGVCYPSNGTCDGDGDCRPDHSCNFLGFCSGCSADGDCRSGQRCLFGTCVPLD